MTNDAKQSEEVQHLYRRDGTPSGVFLARQSAPHQSPAEQVPESAHAMVAADPAPAAGPIFPNGNTAGPSAVEEVRKHRQCISTMPVTSFIVALRHAEALDRLRAENERLTNAVSHWHGRSTEYWLLAQERLKRAERAEAALRGGVVVPEVPTRRMLKAGAFAFDPAAFSHTNGADQVYRAMLAAAKEGKSNG